MFGRVVELLFVQVPIRHIVAQPTHGELHRVPANEPAAHIAEEIEVIAPPRPRDTAALHALVALGGLQRPVLPL